MVYFDRTMQGADVTFINGTLNMLGTLMNAELLREDNAALVFQRDKSNDASIYVLADDKLFSQKNI
jgi:hypothetical protein